MWAHQAEFKVVAMCRVFKVLRESYYAWRRRQLKRAQALASGPDDLQVLQKIRTIHAKSRQSYGVNRITACIRQWNSSISRRRVCRLMKEHKIQGISRRRRFKTTHRGSRWHGIQDHVNRNFEASRPRQLVASDASAIPMRQGMAYLAVTLDVYSRKVLGWEVARQQDAGLMMQVLQKVVHRGACRGLVHHSDQGSQYSSGLFQQMCREHGIVQSMGSAGDCYDNALVESFFATLKTEWLQNRRFGSLHELRLELRRYIDNFYNAERLHSSLEFVSPNMYEARFREFALSGAGAGSS